jgi:succinate dehydrogenase / fumarate reductase flavoprotein subunit
MKYHQGIIIGGGLAGLRAAIELNRYNLKAAVISKVFPIRSHSVAAQGGINAALGNHVRGVYDSPMKHAFDTVKGSDYLADQPAAIRMCESAPERILEMEHWGMPFSRTPEGRIAQRPFGGAGFPRTCFAADRTGHMLLHTLYQQTVKFEQAAEREEMVVYDEWMVLGLATDGERCYGVVAIDLRSGAIEQFRADAVVFPKRGAGRIYGKTSNAMTNSGMGMAVPYWSGVPLKDTEFIQFHPTTIIGTNILMTEGCRGEGGYLINKDGYRFLADYPDSKKAMEVAPRDIVSRNIIREVAKGNGIDGKDYVHLDLRHLGAVRIMERLPGIRSICLNYLGLDPIESPIPIQPAQHYTMGGIDANIDGATRLPGLFAAGECSCISVHGANRLGGNSLLETIAYGKIAGEAAGKYIEGAAVANGKAESALEEAERLARARVDGLLKSKGTENPAQLNRELGRIMVDNVGVFREEEGLASAKDEVAKLRERYKNITISYRGGTFNYDLAWAIEYGASIDVAECIVGGALLRKESRGAQARTDYPQRDDAEWLKHTLATYTPEGPKFSYSEVALGTFEPKERKY